MQLRTVLESVESFKHENPILAESIVAGFLTILEAFGVDDQESPEEIEQLLEQFKQGQISASDVAHILLGIKKGPKVEWENVPAHYELSR